MSNEGSVTIQWKTDSPTGTRVQYGLSPDKLSERAESEVGTDHRVTLKNLKPGAKYFYTAGTARMPLATNFFVTPGCSSKAAATPTLTESRPSRAPPKEAPTLKVPPTRQTWGNMASLQDHFDRHGADFKSKDPEEYARQAWEFLQRAKAESLPMKLDEDGVLRVFDPKSRAFAAYNRNGTTRTYFKPNSRDYFERQPGRPVKPDELKF